MSLFQNSVLNKYLTEANQLEIQSGYDKLVAYFHNPVIQQNIRECKEEEYQGGFLIALFVNVFGYTLKPNPDFNLTREFKNEKGAKKADGAILKDGFAIGVIELKSTTTKDLESIRLQAFDYKANQQKCVYVITSNFEKVRFYINNAVEFEEFDLFRLSFDQFKIMWLCLAKENLLNGIPLAIKEDSAIKEQDITKNIYLDYSAFKKSLYNDLIENNLNLEIFKEKDEKEIKLHLFKKSQKLIDRFLFIFFGEDRGLLPPNSISKIIKQWENQSDWGDDVHLYDRYKKYFHLLNTGWKGKQDEIFAYNGGLFAPDEVLDSVKISDAVLKKHTKVLTTYDFKTEVDVNILGHIFENSLNEIEEVAAQIEGAYVDLKKSKRKKDGIFYTPKYITKYIVENTVGKLCKEKKAELGILDFDYDKDFKLKTWRVFELVTEVMVKNEVRQVIEKRKTNISVEGTKQLEILNNYRDWLLKLTICDPACGSGAFLNQALDFLITEHNTVTELTQKITGDVSTMFIDIENQILEHNIYGVDINEESIEIAKLSLWLRTAQKGRKLTTLSNNIKCGNSLIDDPAVAGEKAFHWPAEFPEVFANGGFDVVIGNPPYVNANDLKKNSTIEEYEFLKDNYSTAKGTVDLYIYFFEKGLKIINHSGLLSYITPNRYLSASYGKALRELILNDFQLIALVDYSDKKVFPDASTYPVISFFGNKIDKVDNVITGKFDDITKTLISKDFPSNRLNILEDSILGFLLNDKLDITEKIINQSIPLDKVGKINATSTAGEADNFSKLINQKDGFKLINTGTIDPYLTTWGIDKLIDKGIKYLTPFLPKSHAEISLNRQNLYSSQKIVISKIGLKCEAFYDKDGSYASINTNCIYSFNESFLPEYVLCWINSKLYNYTFECLFDGLRMSGGYLLFSAPNLRNTSIKEIEKEKQTPFVHMAELMTVNHTEFLKLKSSFEIHLQTKFGQENLSNKLQKWYELELTDFLKELQKAKIKFTLSEESEWLQYFSEQKQKAQTLKSEIDKTDREIDRMVYELYGLTEEEIKIVEESTK